MLPGSLEAFGSRCPLKLVWLLLLRRQCLEVVEQARELTHGQAVHQPGRHDGGWQRLALHDVLHIVGRFLGSDVANRYLVRAFAHNKPHVHLPALESENVRHETLGDGLVRVQDVLGEVWPLVGLRDVAEIRSLLRLVLRNGVARSAGLPREELLAKSRVALRVQDLRDDILDLHGAYQRPAVFDALCQPHLAGGVLSLLRDGLVGIVERGEDFVGIGAVLDFTRSAEDLRATLRIQPTCFESLGRKFA